MNLRKLSWFLVIPAVLVLSGFLGWWWLLNTESGARWIVEKATSAAAAPIEIGKISGDISSGLIMETLRFEGDSARIEAKTLEIAASIGFFPITVDVPRLHVVGLRIQSTASSSEETSSGKPAEAFEPPFPLAFGDIQISGIEYLDSTGEDALIIDSIEAAGSLDKSLVLDRLVIASPEDQLEISGRLSLTEPYAMDLKFRSGGRFILDGSLAGDTDSAEIIIDATSHDVEVIGTVSRLLDQPSWVGEVNSPALHWPLDAETHVAMISDVKVQTSGTWPDFQANLSAILEVQGLDPLQVRASGVGTERDFTVQDLALNGSGLSLDASGVVDWENTLRIGTNASLNRLDPGRWLPDWPENHPVSGVFGLEWESGNLAIRQFTIAVAETPFSAQGQAKMDVDSDIVDAELSWKAASWPFDSLAPAVASENGTLRITGKPDRWQISGDFDLRAGDFPPGHLQLNGDGTTESMNLSIREAETLGGTVTGNLSWNWTGKQPFEANLSARQVDISPLFPGYPGILNTRLALDGDVEPFRLGVVIEELDGVIRGHPVTGRGGISIEQDRVFASKLHLGSGESTLDLHGSLYEPRGMDFSADVDSLSRFLPEYLGTFSAQGNISLNPDAPRVSIMLSGKDLLLGSVRIGQIDSLAVSGSSDEPESEIQLSGLVVGQQPVESVTFRLGGAKPLDSIGIRAKTSNADIGMRLRGSIIDWSDPAGSGWRGELSELRIDHQGQFNLTQDQPSGIEWTPLQFKLEPVCMSSTGDARLCVASTMHESGDLSISAEIVALPLGLLEMISDTELKFSQILNGTLDWSQTSANGRSGIARFEISPGTIRLEDDDEVLLETGPGRFGFDLDGGTLQNGNLDFAIPGTGDVDVDFSVPDLALGSESPVLGHVRVKFHDLEALGPIFPLLDSVGGALDVNLALTGSLGDPAFHGEASLTNGRFLNRASGFSFSEINVNGEITRKDSASLLGTFRAGEGTGTIDAKVTFENLVSPVAELQLKGESLTLIDVPDLNIVANPDVGLAWRDSALEINGRLFIPKARLAPSYLPRQSVRQSEDVVVVAGELEESDEGGQRSKPLRIRGTLEIELGKQAQIDMAVAKVQVFGTTRFKWQDELLPTADGNFDIRGDIQAYGQSLKITQGRISFPSIPANNPHLNIRAERSIYGNSQIQKAGLMVAGTVKRPVVEAYTVPMTNKDRAQTLLVTGSDFNYEQGVGAVAVGAYVLPRLYISYGIGVFEEGNVISARYDLGKRFGVKVTSGQKDTGVDLNYTIER